MAASQKEKVGTQKMEHGICRLCLKEADLNDSHYIPRRAYSMNMARSLKNPNPIVMSHGKLKQVADQLRGYTFCHDCEQLLSKKGEKWVLANIPEDQGSQFPLQDALLPENPVFIGEQINIYAGRKIKAFDMDQLIYFGMSMFWRGAAREWKSSQGGIAPTVNLGEYYEPMRQFLLGNRFPDDVVMLFYVHNLNPVMNAVTPALLARDHTAEFHWFYLNGLGFKLHLGKRVPEQIRRLCVHCSPEGFVLVDNEFGNMVRDYLKDRLTSQVPSAKLQDFLKGPDPRKKP